MYTEHFQLTDEFISHLEATVSPSGDAYALSRYTGFVAVSAVTVYELSVKEIFCEFATSRHRILGSLTAAIFKKINGRVRIEAIRKDYLRKFGQLYLDRFDRHLRVCRAHHMTKSRLDVFSAYENVITWRNEFAHEGRIPATATFGEVKQSYEVGKLVLRCVHASLLKDH